MNECNETINKSIDRSKYIRDTKNGEPDTKSKTGDQIYVTEVDINYDKCPIKSEPEVVNKEQEVIDNNCVNPYEETEVSEIKIEIIPEEIKEKFVDTVKEEYASNEGVSIDYKNNNVMSNVIKQRHKRRNNSLTINVTANEDCQLQIKKEPVFEDKTKMIEMQTYSLDTIKAQNKNIRTKQLNESVDTDEAASTRARNLMLTDIKSINKLFICNICDKTFYRKFILLRHIQNHPKLYNCTYCSYKAIYKGVLTHHINFRHRNFSLASVETLLFDTKLNSVFVCDICDKMFHRKCTLIRHIKNHPRLFYCTYCSYKANQKSNLKHHINVKHTRGLSFDCPYCGYKSFRKQHLTDHVNAKHTKSTSFDCPYCSHKTYRQYRLTLHINTKHTKTNYFYCSYCCYKTNQKVHLREHVNATHTKSISYNCSHCSYVAYNKRTLDRHINSKHTKNSVHNCSYCSYETYRKGYLDRHVNAKHTRATSFDCPHCSCKVFSKHALNEHINSKHSQNTVYNCSYCSYKTYNKHLFSQHVNAKHTKSISFDCSYCNFKTYYKDKLKKHVKRKHS